MLLTKKNILEVLPGFHDHLFKHAKTKRHEKRLNTILSVLKRKGVIKVEKHEEEIKDDKGEIVKKVITYYSKT